MNEYALAKVQLLSIFDSLYLIEDSKVYHQHNTIHNKIEWHFYAKSSETEMADCKKHKEY